MTRAAAYSIDGEDCDVQRHGDFVWRASTRNAWVLTVAGIHVASVTRNRSWKALGQSKPWQVEIFGTPWVKALSGDKNWFRTLDDGRIAAERVLKAMVRDLALACGVGRE